MSTWCPHTTHRSCSITMAKLFQMLFVKLQYLLFHRKRCRKINGQRG
uniref:Uncharacterized protein n=1 Tax=Anguilla anguilla TaxID=7936 RepID=A0A0E9WEG3_ANGAN